MCHVLFVLIKKCLLYINTFNLYSVINIKMYRNLNQLRKLIKFNQPKRLFSNNIDENAPIKFSTSEAAKRRVTPIVKYVNRKSMPWYQPYSVVGSVAVFLIYFCVLREENDIDKEFDKTLYDRIQGLEKAQLLQTYKFNKEHGKSVVEIEQRLKELEASEAKVAG